MTRHDGIVRAFDTIQSPIFDAEGKVKMLVAVSRDITERNEVIARLRKSERDADAVRSGGVP